ncbi:VOC family protein [Sorangium sp. So ce1014]|uniref:VOC family protein n=1 Tax=Sorangium sp. So ce1014 TaxID=3133326 RepID=UPI003F606D0E
MSDLLVNIDVPELEPAIAFYTRAFGLRVGRRFGASFVELLGAAIPLYLLVKPAGLAPAAGASPRDYRRHWTPVHLDFVVDDLEAAARRAQEAGAVPEADIEVAAWGRMLRLADPFGHGVCLLQFSGRGYDEIATPG